MTDQEFDAQKARLQALQEKWHVVLGLKWWKVDYVYFQDEKIPSNCEVGWNVVANASVKWEYRDAKIRFDMAEVALLSDEELENIFVHECCHVLVNQMREWAPEDIPVDRHKFGLKSEEVVVTALARAFIWVREAGAEDPKPALKEKTDG